MRKKIYDWPGVEYHSAEWWRLWREQNADKYRGYKRQYDSSRYKTNPTSERARRKRWAEANPDKIRAHKLLSYSLKKGAITKLPCEKCGTTERVVAHHDDYTRPLDVVWLCELHHKERHRIISTNV